MLIFGYLTLLVVFGYLLIKATSHLVDELRKLAQITRLGKFGLTAFLLAFATSLPEFIVGISAALEGRPELSLGNVIGSNIADISFVMGGVAIVGGSISVLGEFLKRDLFSTFLAGALPLLLLVDGRITRIDGVVLLAVYVWFTYTVLSKKTAEMAKYQETGLPLMHRVFLRLNHKEVRHHFLHLISWVIVLIISADMLVKISIAFANLLGIPVILIGLFFLALGTSLPEFAFELRAMRSHETAMVFGDLLGSVVANSTLILGITAIIKPIILDGGFTPYLMATIAFVVVFSMFWIFTSTKQTLERWEGVLLLMVYLLFVYYEFSRMSGSSISHLVK
jgi:cation:H+ antiporter